MSREADLGNFLLLKPREILKQEAWGISSKVKRWLCKPEDIVEKIYDMDTNNYAVKDNPPDMIDILNFLQDFPQAQDRLIKMGILKSKTMDDRLADLLNKNGGESI